MDYLATTTHWHAERAALRPKSAELAVNKTLRAYVQDPLAGLVVAPCGAAVLGPKVFWEVCRPRLRKDWRWSFVWSSEQIAHQLRYDFPDDQTMCISHEAICQSLYVQGRGALRCELTACLRPGHAFARATGAQRMPGQSFIVPEIMISELPAEVADTALPDHREGDLILGLYSSATGTLMERTTRFTQLLHLPRMAARSVSARIKNGPQLAGHGAELFEKALPAQSSACRRNSDDR